MESECVGDLGDGLNFQLVTSYVARVMAILIAQITQLCNMKVLILKLAIDFSKV